MAVTMRVAWQLVAKRSTAGGIISKACKCPANATAAAAIATPFSYGATLATQQATSISTSAVMCRSKRSYAQEPAAEVVEDVPVMRTKGKGAKAGKGGRSKAGRDVDNDDDAEQYRTSTKNTELPGEAFQGDEAVATGMQRAAQRCRETITRMVGSHGRADPSLLDNVRVTVPSSDPARDTHQVSRQDGSGSHNIKEFATIGIRDGALVVTCFDPNSLKYVERAIYAAELGLTPQRIQDGDDEILRIAVPRPTAETRAQLMRDVSKVCENARNSIRKVRQEARKQIASDEKRKVIDKDEAARENKRVEDEVKKLTSEVDKLQADTQKNLDRNQ